MVTVKFDHGPVKVVVTQDYDDTAGGGHVRVCAFNKNGAIVFCNESTGPMPVGGINDRDLDGWILCEIKRKVSDRVLYLRSVGLMGD